MSTHLSKPKVDENSKNITEFTPTSQEDANIFELAEQLNKLYQQNNEFPEEPEDISPEYENWKNAHDALLDEMKNIENTISSFPAVTFSELLVKARLAELEHSYGFLNHKDSEYFEDVIVKNLTRNLEQLAGVPAPPENGKTTDLLYGFSSTHKSPARIAGTA